MKQYIKYKGWLLASLLILFAYLSMAQQKDQSLIGTTCPDFKLNNIINNTVGATKISDFKGKLLILDFWATWCSPCIASFPKMELLQKEFGNKLFILSVTDQSPSIVTDFFASMKKSSGLNPISVTGDKELKAYFTPRLIPHYVWINEEGKIIAITNMEAVTKENVQKALTNNVVKTKTKLRKIFTNLYSPAFAIGKVSKDGEAASVQELPNSSLLHRSVLTSYLKDYQGYTSFDSIRITSINTPMPQLFTHAIGHLLDGKNNSWTYFFSGKRTLWEVRDTARSYLKPDSVMRIVDEAQKERLRERIGFCYELVMPSANENEKYRIMLNELNTLFGSMFHISAGVERRKVKCLAFQLLPGSKSPLSKGGEEKSTESAFSFTMTNHRFSWFIARMATYYYQLEPLPIIDETGLGVQKVDLNVQCKLGNFKELNKELNKNGLQIVEVERELDMIVIKDSLPL